MSTLAMSTRQKAWVDRISVGLFSLVWIIAATRFAPFFLSAFFLGPELAESGAGAGAGRLLVETFGPHLRLGVALAMGLGGITGYLLADLIAGMVHWIADRFFDPETPLLGPMLIAPFREHHVDALGITRHDFFEVSGNNALITIPLVGLIFLIPEPTTFAAFFLIAHLFSLSLALVATNQFHRWAHTPSPPPLAKRLHAWGLILTPRGHAVHHRRGHDRAYCVTSGWLNPLLDRARLFPRIEHLLAAAQKAKRS
ncbi:MAG: fatty acid desaturase CarF family protein [Myxococcota bacterium]